MISKAVRDAVQGRAGGRCERCGHRRDPMVLHHRRLRSQGGQDTVENLVFICQEPCHRHIHEHPSASYEAGWLVPSWADPSTVAVVPV